MDKLTKKLYEKHYLKVVKCRLCRQEYGTDYKTEKEQLCPVCFWKVKDKRSRLSK